MNRIIVIAGLAIIALVGFALTRETENIKTVKINLPALKAMEYFADSENINKWMIPFANNPAPFQNNRMINQADTLDLVKQSLLKLDFRRSNPSGKLDFSISVVADKDSSHLSYFVLDYHTPKWQSAFGNNQMAKDAESSLDSLTSYLNNSEKLYGFHIRGELVEDTSFLFASQKIRRADFEKESIALFDMLIAEANKRKAGYNGVRIFHFTNGSDSTRTIYAGVGVTKRVETKEGEKVSYSMMPYQKNLLVLDFAGKYSDVQKAYTALERFRVDNQFITMAIPFHKYLDSGYGFSESQVVRLKVCYPVF